MSAGTQAATTAFHCATSAGVAAAASTRGDCAISRCWRSIQSRFSPTNFRMVASGRCRGADTSMRPSGGFTLRCMFLMALRVSQTSKPSIKTSSGGIVFAGRFLVAAMGFFDSLRSLRMTRGLASGLHGQVVGVVAGDAELDGKALGDLFGAQALRHELGSARGGRCRRNLGAGGRLRLTRRVYHERDLAANAAGLLSTGRKKLT